MTALKRILAAIGYSLLFAAFILIAASKGHGHHLDLSHWPDALLWGTITLVVGFGLLALVVVVVGFLLHGFGLGQEGPPRFPRKPNASQLAKAQQFAGEEESSAQEIRTPPTRALPTAEVLRQEAKPDARATRAGWRKLAWNHVGWTFLLVGFLWGFPAFILAALLGRASPFGPDNPFGELSWLIPASYAAYGTALLLATRGPRPSVSAAPDWVRTLFLWRMRRYGYPLLCPIVAALPLGLLLLRGRL